MKLTQLQAFEKHLQGSKDFGYARVYLLLTPESYQLKCAESLVLEYACKGAERQTFDGASLSVECLRDELDSLSLFAQKRVILIRQADKLSKPLQEVCVAYYAQMHPSITLVLSGSAVHRSSRFYTQAEKHGIVFDAPEEKPWEKERSVPDWVVQYCAAEKKRIEPAAVKELVSRLGTDRGQLAMELDKLICYIGESEHLRAEDVRTMTQGVPHETIWKLGEAIFFRQTAEALRIGGSLLDGEAPFLTLLNQIRSQFQTEFQVCSLIAQGKGREAVSAQFPYMRGNILDKHLKQAQNYGIEAFRRGLVLIGKAEMDAKSGTTDPYLLTETLIVKLTR